MYAGLDGFVEYVEYPRHEFILSIIRRGVIFEILLQKFIGRFFIRKVLVQRYMDIIIIIPGFAKVHMKTNNV